MTPDLAAIWESMERAPTTHIAIRRLTTAYDDGLFIGYDPVNRRRLFIVELREGAHRVIARAARWRQLRVDAFPTDASREAVAVSTPNEAYADIFTALVTDLYAYLTPLRADRTLLEHLLERLEKWHRFLEERPPEGLPWEAQRGLFGELTLLTDLINGAIGTKSVDTWKGPEGHIHDFVLDRGDIEVKVATPRERLIHINGAEQLDPPPHGGLHVYAIELEVSETAGVSLPDLVTRVRELFEGAGGNSALLRSKLLAAGYADADASRYPARHIVRAVHLYEVATGFPRIAAAPEGVVDVRYKLRLNDLTPFRAADLTSTLTRIAGG